MHSGLQGERRLVHQDVPLGGRGPQGLLGGRSGDPSKLAATVRQQGQLETRDNVVSGGNHGNFTGVNECQKSTKPVRTYATVSFESLFCLMLPSRSCPAQRVRPGSGATSVWCARACTRRRRSVRHAAAAPAPSLRLKTPEGTERKQELFISVGQDMCACTELQTFAPVSVT